MSDSMVKPFESRTEKSSRAQVRRPGAGLVVGSILGGSAAQVSTRVADLRAELEEWLEVNPDDYYSLVLLGELNLRIGLKRSAREFLYRASLLKPPSWEDYQRTSMLLRRAEADQARELERVAGAPPPA